MKKTAILTDSSCDLPKHFIDEHHIYVLPLRMIYSDGEFEDRVDITPEQVYARLEEEVPTTSLPSPRRIKDTIDKIVDDGFEQVIGVFISSRLSGTYNLVRQIFNDEKRLTYKLYDSKSLSLVLGLIVYGVVEKVKTGLPLDAFDRVVQDLMDRSKGFYVVKSLEYLRKGGRIGNIEGAIGEILQVKPIISVNREGVYYTYKKVRKRKRSIEELIKIAKSYAPRQVICGLVHGNAHQEIDAIKEIIDKLSHVNVLFVEQISPSLSVHTGAGLLGIILQEV